MARRDRPLAGFHAAGIEPELLAELFGAHRGMGGPSRPDTDVYMTEDPPTLNITIDAAGLDPDSLGVVIDGDVLTVTGQRRRPEAHGRRVYHHAEIDWGRFERRLRLSTPVDPDAGSVTYERGLLQIALPLATRPVITRVLLTVTVAK